MVPFWRNTAISAALHAGIILALMVASVISFHRRQTRFPDPMMIQMVEAPPEPGKIAAPPPPAPDKKAIPDPPKKKPPPPKKPPAKPPEKKQPPPPDKPKLTPQELARLLDDALKTTAPAPASTAPADDWQWYYRIVYQALYDAWQQPGVLSRTAGLTTTVLIRVQRDGTISQRSLLRSSGNGIMDQSVMEAVGSVTRLRPLPPAWGGLHKDISVDFLLTDASL